MQPVALFPKLENEKLEKLPLLDISEESTQPELFNPKRGANTRIKLVSWNYEKNKKAEGNSPW